MPYHTACCPMSCGATRDQTWRVCHRCACLRKDNLGAVRDCIEESQEGNFVGRKTWMCSRAAADLGNVHRAAGKGRENDPVREGAVPRKADEVGFLARHGGGCRVVGFTLSWVELYERCNFLVL